MSVVSFDDYRPAARYDSIPWSQVQIEEADTEDGDSITGLWTLIDTQALVPLDPDPTAPMLRSFTTTLASDTPELWYRVIWVDAGSNTSQPTIPVQNIVTVPAVSAYATTTELARILHISSPTATQTTAMQRVLDAAALEIDAELGLTAPYSDPPAIVVEVNLERAVEHWQQMESPFGIIPVAFGGESGATYTARDSWDRHAHKLAPLKLEWGFA